MSKTYSAIRPDHIEYSLWLIFDDRGSVRSTRAEPQLARNERGMALTVKLPIALFRTPSLRASISVEGELSPITIDTSAAADALKQALGVDVDLAIHTAERTSPAADGDTPGN